LQDHVLEPTSGATRQLRHQSFQRACEELERVFEDDVLPPGDGQLLLQPLADDADLLLKHFECQSEDVAVVSPEVVEVAEQDGDLVALPCLKIAHVVSCSVKLADVVVLVAHFVLPSGM